MTTNVPFRVHEDQETRDDNNFTSIFQNIYNIRTTRLNPIESILMMLDVATVLGPIIDRSVNEAINEAINENFHEGGLEKTDNILNVSSQRYRTVGNKVGDGQCSICITELEDESFVTRLECGHIFHMECIMEWGKYKAECPLCKKGISVLGTL